MLIISVDFMYVLPSVRPVVEWYRVSLGVTDTTVSWIVQGKLTRPNLLCQVTTDPGSTTEVTGSTKIFRLQNYCCWTFQCCLVTPCVLVSAELQ